MAKTLMVQGTMSSAGKSLITAGLCRVFHQDGYRVAPFKSQNMALNSYITRDGLEMGRAQALQAEAAGIEPSVLMNPILLKPTSDAGSQVIVNGVAAGTMPGAAYFDYKKQLRPVVQAAFDTLAKDNDIVVIEGAGSPAEINLNEDDIVNMGMAKMARAPVLLVADIDRGGVFASIYGTVMLLDQEERSRIKGVIINKFRGDVELLRPGLDMIEELSGVPVIGVLPYLEIDIDDEDSVTERFGKTAVRKDLDIAVILLPRISNATDFDALARIKQVGLRYVRDVDRLGQPDLILLPGTKNTMADLKWMRHNGLEAAVLRHAAEGKPVGGICGGYQMLGETLADPLAIEEGGKIDGLGLLPIQTVFRPQKIRAQVSGTVCDIEGMFAPLSGAAFHGYEIHQGVSTHSGTAQPFAQMGGGVQDGAVRGNVFGCYPHGLLDGQVAERLVQLLLAQKGITGAVIETVDVRRHKQRQFDLLVDALRTHVDMDAVYSILEKGDGKESV